jgi:branched-subunit amino acid transport protein AzlD
MTTKQLFLTILIMALITAALRFAPFFVFGQGKATPKIIIKLGLVLPFAIMGMLVVYCLKDVSVVNFPHGLPEMISIVLVAFLHIWKKNVLLSMIAGTACYMILIQTFFA